MLLESLFCCVKEACAVTQHTTTNSGGLMHTEFENTDMSVNR